MGMNKEFSYNDLGPLRLLHWPKQNQRENADFVSVLVMIVNLESEIVTWLATVIFWVVSMQHVSHGDINLTSTELFALIKFVFGHP